MVKLWLAHARLRQRFGCRQVRRHSKHREQLIIIHHSALCSTFIILFSERITYIATPLYIHLISLPRPPSPANYYLVTTISYGQPYQSWPSRLAGWSRSCFLSEGPSITLAQQILWTVLILALTGNMIHEAKAGNPSIVNYVIFVAVFAIVSLVYLTLASAKPSFAVSPLLLVLVDGLCTLFFLIGGIALAAKLGVHSCGNQVGLSYISTIL